MAIEIKMPQLSDTMHSGKILSWLKKEGELVKRGDILAEVETDKATLEIESFQEGYLIKIAVPVESFAEVGQTIAYLGKEGGNIENIQGTHANYFQKPLNSSVLQDKPEKTPTRQSIKASPLAKRIAAENQVDISKIKGSGPAGRILRKDLEGFLKEDLSETVKSADPVIHSTTKADSLKEVRINPSKMRRSIAERMQASFSNIPHFFATTTVKMKAVQELRKQLKNSNKFKDASITHFIIKATAIALAEEPLINSHFADGQLVQPSDINIGIVDLVDDGLLVPVIHNCGQLSFKRIIDETHAALLRARSGKLSTKDLNEGTFTISNMGKSGIESFTAIINPGQGAILAVGTVHEQICVENGCAVIMPVLKATLSVDHRVCDGMSAASFLNKFRLNLEQPALMFV